MYDNTPAKTKVSHAAVQERLQENSKTSLLLDEPALAQIACNWQKTEKGVKQKSVIREDARRDHLETVGPLSQDITPPKPVFAVWQKHFDDL